ncbi:MAG: hypothetical protein ABEH64_10995 [Salinirussus sp.]
MAEISDERATRLVSAARTSVGDQLRSVAYFDEDDVEQVYLRDGLDRTADLVGFADNERLGFRSQRTYRNTQLGAYDFKIRVFEHGYLTRVIVGDRGVWVTTDAMPINRFEELAAAIRGVLREE